MQVFTRRDHASIDPEELRAVTAPPDDILSPFWYNLPVESKEHRGERNMPTYLFVIQVDPLEGNPHTQVIAGGFARLCVIAPDPQSAVAHAHQYLAHHHWRPLSFLEEPSELQAGHKEDNETKQLLALALKTGLACQFFGYPQEGTSVEMN